MLVADDVGQIAAPAVAPLIGVQTVSHCGIGGALHGHVEGRIDPQAALVHRFGSIGRFQILANLFHEIGRQFIPR